MEDALLAVLVGIDIDLLQTDSIFETLLVDNVLQVILLACLSTSCREVPATTDHADGIPTLGHYFLPLGNILSQLVVVLGNLLEALSLFVVELLIIVVKLTLHRIMRSDLGDRVPNDLEPALRDAILILIIIKRYNLVLEQTIDSSGIETVLILLVLVGALLGKCPSSTLAITLQPPTILHREVDDTVHLCLFARGTRSLHRTCRGIHPDVNT